jgi:hypothetical protein
MNTGSSSRIPLEVLLAEYSALRNEIILLFQMQSNVFALQLTATAAIFSFSLSSHSRTAFLLILPLLTYALTRRYQETTAGIVRISTYIAQELSPQVQGGFAWEEWNRKLMRSNRAALFPRYYKIIDWINPIPLVFPWSSMAAVAWVAGYIWFHHNVSGLNRSMLTIIWLLDFMLTLLTLYIIIRRPLARLGWFKRANQKLPI